MDASNSRYQVPRGGGLWCGIPGLSEVRHAWAAKCAVLAAKSMENDSNFNSGTTNLSSSSSSNHVVSGSNKGVDTKDPRLWNSSSRPYDIVEHNRYDDSTTPAYPTKFRCRGRIGRGGRLVIDRIPVIKILIK